MFSLPSGIRSLIGWVLQCMGEVQTDAGRGYREMIKDQEVGTNCRHVGTIIHVAFKGPVKPVLAVLGLRHQFLFGVCGAAVPRPACTALKLPTAR